MCAGEVARIDDVDVAQRPGDLTCLFASELVQLRVRMALPAAVAIPVGFAVSDEEEGGHATH